MIIRHGDAVESLRGTRDAGDVRCAMLRDPLVSCDIQLRVLTPGSLDALPRALLGVLEQMGPCTLQTLACSVGAHGHGTVTVSEVLGVLLRANEITVDYSRTSEPVFARSPINHSVGKRSDERVVETSLRFVPRSGHLADRITGLDGYELDKLRMVNGFEWWIAPDDRALYADEALPELVRAACIELYRGRAVLPKVEVDDVREEILQRARLKSAEYVFLDATVLKATVIPYFVVHRCYLFRSTGLGSYDWHIVVHPSWRGPREEGYTRYLRELVRRSPEMLESLLAAANPCE